MRRAARWWLLGVGLSAGLAWSGPSRAWGATGHQTTGAIADALLAGTHAGERVTALLGMDLRTASVWADCAKGVSPSGGGFHYTASPKYPECAPFESEAGEARMIDYVTRNWSACRAAVGEDPCHKQYHYTDVAVERDSYERTDVGTSDHDVVAAIRAAIIVLQGGTAPAPFSIRDGAEALLILSHDVGDVHQPLHVGAVYLDAQGREVDPDRGMFDPQTKTRGANQLIDHGRPLHMEWDRVIARLNADHLGRSGVAEARSVLVTPGPATAWADVWATETLMASRAAFQNVAFGARDAATHRWSVALPDGYSSMRTALQERQLVLAGARVAQVLEAIFP